MSNPIKICVIGAGSSYTPELVEGILEHQQELPVRELSLMDIDERKLSIVGGLACRMAQASEAGIQVELTQDRRNALADADYVIVQIRVGGMAARILDEKIPLKYGVVGQETTGPGGFAKALRTIPVLLDIAREMETLAPGAYLINFTNPAGLVTEALQQYTSVPSIGLCNLPIGTEMQVAKMLGVNRKRLSLDWVGLNHLNWVRDVSMDGKTVWPHVFSKEVESAHQQAAEDWGFSAELLETLGMMPCSYLNYFYNHPKVLAKLQKASRTRGEEVAEIEAQLMEMYQDPDLTEKPELLEKRGGAYYSKVAVSLISAIANNKQEVHIVNTRSRGAIANLPYDAVVEVPAVIGASGARPLVTAPLPPEISGLVQAVKAYEQLTAFAAVSGDRKVALQALLAHPLVPSFDAAQGLLKDLLDAHRPHLPQFFNEV